MGTPTIPRANRNEASHRPSAPYSATTIFSVAASPPLQHFLPFSFFRVSLANRIDPIDVTQLDYTTAENDPVGSVSIFKRQWKTSTYEPACEVGFDKFNTEARTERLVSRGMRKGGMDFTTFAMVS